jgi:hypothetical protein
MPKSTKKSVEKCEKECEKECEEKVVKKPRKPKKEKKEPKDNIKKEKKPPSKYALFVKSKYDSVRNLPCRDRFKAISKMWKEEKESKK